MSLTANVTISRFSSNMEPREGITIRIGDELSGTEIIEVTMTVEEFGRAATGLAHAKGTHDATPASLLRLASLVGKKVRSETVLVKFDIHKEKRDDLATIKRMVRDIKREFGCASVRTSDLFNHHQISKKAPGHQNVVVWYYDEVTEEA
jgi:hypothetical protein